MLRVRVVVVEALVGTVGTSAARTLAARTLVVRIRGKAASTAVGLPAVAVDRGGVGCGTSSQCVRVPRMRNIGCHAVVVFSAAICLRAVVVGLGVGLDVAPAEVVAVVVAPFFSPTVPPVFPISVVGPLPLSSPSSSGLPARTSLRSAPFVSPPLSGSSCDSASPPLFPRSLYSVLLSLPLRRLHRPFPIFPPSSRRALLVLLRAFHLLSPNPAPFFATLITPSPSLLSPSGSCV